MSDFLVFSTRSGARYLYDTPTNTIHPWPDPLDETWAERIYAATTDEELDRLQALADPEVARRMRYVQLWRRNTAAFRTPPVWKPLRLSSFAEVPRDQRGQPWAMDMVLVVSEDCNLRCDYCSFSGFYPALRSHGSRLMDLSTGKKAIDLWFGIHKTPERQAHSDKRLNLVLYGGEPLVNRQVVRQLTEYASANKPAAVELAISLSTNLTLLRDDDLPFLRDHDIFLCVSVDGPREEHDRHRHFRGGRPTYDKVHANLQKVRDFDADYYDARVRVQPTINGNTDLPAIQKFFENSEDPPLRLRLVSLLRDMKGCDFHRAYPYDPALYNRRLGQVCDDYFDRKVKGESFVSGDFLYALPDEGLRMMSQRLQTRYNPNTLSVPACVPGRKLAVVPDGSIHMCERIGPGFSFGHVVSGLDEAAMVDLINRYLASLPGCEKCWSRSLCPLCMAAVGEQGELRFGERCAEVRSELASSLAFLCSIMEHRPKAFEPAEEAAPDWEAVNKGDFQ